jgi:hypothetical protein
LVRHWAVKEVAMAIIEFGTDRLEVGLEPDVALVRDDLIDNSVSAPVADEVAREPAVVGRPLLDGLTERLSPWWAAGLAVAWVAIFSGGVILEPAPSDPDAAMPLIEGLMVTGLMLGWLVTAVGLAARRRYGALGSLFAGVVLVGITIACPVSGHHSGIGAWWLFEAAGSAALVGLSARALRRA